MKQINLEDQVQIFKILEKLYHSYNGESLESKDWLAITKTIEGFNTKFDNMILKLQPETKTPILIQPTKILADAFNMENNPLCSRAATIVNSFDFVFQLIKAPRIKGVGPSLETVINHELKKYGLCLGLDISEHEEYLNSFAANKLLFPTSYDPFKHSFIFCPEQDYSRSFNFSFDPSITISAKFSYQIWTVKFMGLSVSSTRFYELHDLMSEKIYQIWISQPNSLKNTPMLWIEVEQSKGNTTYVNKLWSDTPSRTRPEELYSQNQDSNKTVITNKLS